MVIGTNIGIHHLHILNIKITFFETHHPQFWDIAYFSCRNNIGLIYNLEMLATNVNLIQINNVYLAQQYNARDINHDEKM